MESPNKQSLEGHSYLEIITKAIINLKEQPGCSASSIIKFVQSNYKGIDLLKLKTEIKRLEVNGQLEKTNNLYRLSKTLKNSLKNQSKKSPKKAQKVPESSESSNLPPKSPKSSKSPKSESLHNNKSGQILSTPSPKRSKSPKSTPKSKNNTEKKKSVRKHPKATPSPALTKIKKE